MKKYISIIIAMALLSLSLTVLAENEQYTVGAYYQLGKYNDKPIIWRCVSTDDENGILMVRF